MIRISRRAFLLSSTAAVSAAYSYARFGELHWLEQNRYSTSFKNKPLNRPITILHLSDLHFSHYVSLENIRSAIHLGLKGNPHVAVVTGDFTTGKYAIPHLQQYAETLRLLSAAVPTFACAGNHDGGWYSRRFKGLEDLSFLQELLTESKITLLHNSSRQLQIQETLIQWVGVGDLWAGDCSPKLAFRNAARDLPTIVLCHNPDGKDEMKEYGWDLMLSGHTHGGQVRIPFFGAPITNIDDNRYVHGLNNWNSRLVFTNKGVGNIGGIRINCRPEVALITVV